MCVVRVAPPPSPSSATCSLTGGPAVSIQWSPSFTSQYEVEIYRVAVNPAAPNCPSDQMIVSLLSLHMYKMKWHATSGDGKGLWGECTCQGHHDKKLAIATYIIRT